MKNKHMTLDDRIEIQECLAKGISFKDIGKRIGKSATTISREAASPNAQQRIYQNRRSMFALT